MEQTIGQAMVPIIDLMTKEDKSIEGVILLTSCLLTGLLLHEGLEGNSIEFGAHAAMECSKIKQLHLAVFDERMNEETDSEEWNELKQLPIIQSLKQLPIIQEARLNFRTHLNEKKYK